MNTIKHKLEVLSFQAMYPRRYRVLEKALKKARGNHRKVIDIVEKTLKEYFTKTRIKCDISGREKNLYSIYQKMLNKKSSA